MQILVRPAHFGDYVYYEQHEHQEIFFLRTMFSLGFFLWHHHHQPKRSQNMHDCRKTSITNMEIWNLIRFILLVGFCIFDAELPLLEHGCAPRFFYICKFQFPIICYDNFDMVLYYLVLKCHNSNCIETKS